MNLVAHVRDILISVLHIPDETEFDDDTPLNGHYPALNTSSMTQIISAIEDTFGIDIDDEDVEPEIFDDFGSLVEFVEAQVE